MQEVQKTQVWSLGWEDPLEKGMATHSSILAWEIPQIDEPSGLQSMGHKRVGCDLMTKQHVSCWETSSQGGLNTVEQVGWGHFPPPSFIPPHLQTCSVGYLWATWPPLLFLGPALGPLFREGFWDGPRGPQGVNSIPNTARLRITSIITANREPLLPTASLAYGSCLLSCWSKWDLAARQWWGKFGFLFLRWSIEGISLMSGLLPLKKHHLGLDFIFTILNHCN